MAGVHKAAQEAGVPIRFKQKVVDIYRDPVSKRVVGVRVRVRRGEYRDLRARKAVIVATGGCLNNPRLIWEYGSWKHAQFCVPEARGHTGEMYGILFKIGVPIRYPGTLIYASTPLDYYTRAPHTYLAFFSWAGAILVNSEGKRFVNEDAILFPVLGEACFAQPEAVSFAIFDQKILDEIKRRSPHVPLNNFNIFKADTLEGLAKELGISAENLVKEVKEFNDDIKKYGYDKKFGTRIRIMYDEPLVPIDTPPFYGVKCVAGLTSTRGGVFINTRGQVLDGDNNVVPGLYAAGELSTGGFFRDGMYICGTHMSICLAYGPVVGENAARLG
jgi:succinate dehydrogenase/fumarate reductase flavoprotein subunit